MQMEIVPGSVILQRRGVLGWKAVELAQRAGIHPGTLNAIEKGRIRTPSLGNLQSLCQALGISLSSLFASNPNDGVPSIVESSQKGQQTFEFPKYRFRIICFTPLIPHLFVGKVIMSGGAQIEQKILPASGMIFVQTIIGKLSIIFDGVDHVIREGNSAFFDGHFSHTFYNAQHKDLSFLLVTSPSFLSSPSNLLRRDSKSR